MERVVGRPAGRWIAVDGGQSAIRVRDGATGRESAGPGVRHAPGGVVRGMVASLARAVAGAGFEGSAERAVLGMSGLPRTARELDELEDAVRRLTGAREVWLCGDDVTAHAGATGGSAGVVAAVGTGSAVLGVDPAGGLRAVDGRGYLFGDDGSAFQIGRAAVAAALRAADGRDRPTGLVGLAEQRWGPIDGVAQRLYAGDAVVEEVAAFAVDVLTAARDGDDVADGILRCAMEALSASIRAAAAGFGDGEAVPVHLVGGLLRGADVLLPHLDSALSRALPTAHREPARGTPLDGAELLARAGAAGPYGAALRRGVPPPSICGDPLTETPHDEDR